MSFHDAYLRLTPFELAFPGAGSSGGTPLQGATPLREYGVLAFHAVPFQQAGCPVFLLDTALCRSLAGGWAGSGAPAPPGTAGYVQLPRNLFWAHAEPGAPPEPVDGFFWTVSAGAVLHLLLALGMRDGRPGLSIVPVADAPLAEAAGWLAAAVREDGPDFTTTLPGGELQGLLSFTAAGEVLKLAARFFAHLAGSPEASGPGAPGPTDASPAPSRLAYRRVTLGGGGA
ncbi:MAG: hypothetical protein ACYC6F_09485 [Longimicrobiales bacterium]